MQYYSHYHLATTATHMQDQSDISSNNVSRFNSAAADATLLHILPQINCSHVSAPPWRVLRSCSSFPSMSCLAVYSTSLVSALHVGYAMIYSAYLTIQTLYCMPMSLAYCTHCAPPQNVLPKRMMKISPDFRTGFLI